MLDDENITFGQFMKTTLWPYMLSVFLCFVVTLGNYNVAERDELVGHLKNPCNLIFDAKLRFTILLITFRLNFKGDGISGSRDKLTAFKIKLSCT